MSTPKLYQRLADELAHAIREGHLPGGSALPTHRDFAKQRQIGLGTATRIYAELKHRGLVVGEVGRGTFVRERPIEPHPLSEAIRYTAMARTAECVDAPTLRQALRSVSALSDIERLAAQPTPLGSPSARRALALYLSRWGLEVDPARIATTGGGLAAMRLAALVCTQRGCKVATDSVTYPGWRLVGEQLGLEMMPLAFDEHGPLPEALDRLCRRARITAMHCMPTAHHPLGWVMPLRRRRELVALARQHDVTLLEDVTYNHLVRGAPPCLAQLAPERTWLIGSLSGAMGDGLRFGYLVTPCMVGPKLERTTLSWGLAAPPLVVELARLWLGDGTLEALQGAQLEHAEQLWKTVAKTGLRARSPSSAGWLLWLALPRGSRSEMVAVKLRQQGFDALTSEAFCIASSKPNAVAVRMRSMTPTSLREVAPAVAAACGFHLRA